MFDRIFNFIDAEPIEKRMVAYEERGDLQVSTVRVNDGAQPFETGVRHLEEVSYGGPELPPLHAN